METQIAVPGFKTICFMLLCFSLESESRSNKQIENRIDILEQKFGLHAYEYTLMQQDIHKMQDILSNIEDVTIETEGDLTKTEANAGEVKQMETTDVNQKLRELVVATSLLLNAFKNEKQERIRIEMELETLKETQRNIKVDIKTLTESYISEKLENIDNSLQSFVKEDVFKQQTEATGSKLDAMAIVLDELAGSMEEKYQSVATKVTGITESQQHVSFSARLSSSIESLGPWETVVFNNVITNIGNTYSGVTGVFTAPNNGIYVFYTHILATDRPLEMSLQQNGSNKMLLYVHGGHRGSDSNLIVLQLAKGDTVKVVKHGPWGSKPFYVHKVWSTFSGYMLYPI